MAKIDIDWVVSERMSIREIAASCGFNLASGSLKHASKYRDLVISEVATAFLKVLDEEWREHHPKKFLSRVSQGVYVVSFSENIYVQYKKSNSKIIYIGKGQIRNRIRSHLNNWITFISESLQDMRIDISFAEIRVKKAERAFEEVESDLLETFMQRFGEYPLLNKISGRSHHKNHEYQNASLNLLRSQNSKKGWAIRPMPNNVWAKPLDDEE